MATDLQTRPLDGGLLSVPGLSGAGVASGVKGDGALDLALVRTADRPWNAAGVFTRNTVAAAPVHLCRELLSAQPRARTVVINSGNANALTGDRGMADARAMGQRAAERCGGPALVLSTGVIGVPLPIDRVLEGIDEAAAGLSADADEPVAQAILTTDTFAKRAALELVGADTAKRRAAVGGVAKGSGMIHPDMATMLAIVATDFPLDAQLLAEMLPRVVDRSFHQITVDGDTSTNDTVLLLAPPPAEGPRPDAPLLAAVEQAITDVAARLARLIIEDGEGMTRLMDLQVIGAATPAEARRVAETVARSSLVKTALAGGDPNWGRILAVAGNAGVPLDTELLRLTIEGTEVFGRGGVRPFDADELRRSFERSEVRVSLELGRGDAAFHIVTTDLTHGYVTINAEYTT